MTTTRFLVPSLPAGTSPRHALATAWAGVSHRFPLTVVSSTPAPPRREGGALMRRRHTLATALVAALALVLSPAAYAQESEEEERERFHTWVLGDEFRAEATDNPAQAYSYLLFGGAYLGVELVNLNEPLRAHFGVPEGSGVLVSNVADDSPAARAGVQVGDIVTRFNGKDVKSSRRLSSMVRRAEDGDPADLEIWRDGKVETLSATLDERPSPDLSAGSFSFSFRDREDLDGDGEIDVFVAPDGLHEKVQEYFNDDEWKERHEHVQRFLHERRPDMKALEERLEALRERLAELERRLEDRRLDN